MNQRPDEILKQYDENMSLLRPFTEKLRALVEEILLSNDLRVHSIVGRIKERNSLANKIDLDEKKYKLLKDITDVAGIRIITYLADDVDKVAKVIESEFIIDKENSIDKRVMLDPDRFGYLSLHYVVQMSAERQHLSEYRRFPNFKAEIQIRSILQHAWAEIEHDLGYKTQLSIPAQTRRRFSRLAGLLELGDQEFMAIRDELLKYEKEVPQKIEQTPQEVEIDKVSLRTFIETSSLIKELDWKIMDMAGATVREKSKDEFVDDDVKRLKYFGIKTIAEAEHRLKIHSKSIVSFARKWLQDARYQSFMSGISLLYLYYVLISKTANTASVEYFLDLAGIGLSSERSKIAEKIIQTYSTGKLKP